MILAIICAGPGGICCILAHWKIARLSEIWSFIGIYPIIRIVNLRMGYYGFSEALYFYVPVSFSSGFSMIYYEFKPHTT